MPVHPIINVQADQAASTLLASTWLRYNGILLTDVLTEGYECEEVRTEDGAQKLATRHVIKVLALFNPQFNSFVFASATTVQRQARSDVGGSIVIVRDRLMEDRKFLQWAIGGTIVVSAPNLKAPSVAYASDNMLGPKPLYCQVTQITGTSNCYVRFGIEVWTDDCTSANGNVIQSHRYSMSHDVDGDTWLTSRMVQGYVKYRPDLLADRNQSPDQILSPSLFHPVPPGFKRQQVKVQVNPNGMELAYSFIDTEQVLPLGSLSPALRLQAEFSVGSVINEGKPAQTQAVCHVAAMGPKNQHRFNLLIMAIRIALQKLAKPGLIAINEIMVTYSLDNIMVDLTVKALWKPVGIGPQGMQLDTTGLLAAQDRQDIDLALSDFTSIADGESPPGNFPHLAVAPEMAVGGRKGTYLGYCIGSSLVTGCVAATQPLNYEIPVDQYGKAVLNAATDLPPEEANPKTNTGANAEFSLQLTPTLTITPDYTGLSYVFTNGIGFYEDWQMTTRYHTSHNKAVMPVSSAQGGSASTYVPPQIASLGLPYTLKVVDWTIGWIGPDANSIILPSPDTQDPNDVLLAEDISPAVPSICNSTNKAWRVSGTYWYMSKKLRTSSLDAKSQFGYTDEGFAFGKSITDPDSRTANVVGLSRFIAKYSPSFVG